jgi:hypothetical protein
MEELEIKLAGSEVDSWIQALPSIKQVMRTLLQKPMPYGLFTMIDVADEDLREEWNTPGMRESALKKLCIREVDGKRDTLTQLSDIVKTRLFSIDPDNLLSLTEI